ncbi:MAG: septation protein A [Pseudomonadales bacterium]|nr:septation protein A [Pseudomonadales bacterium]
MKAFTDFFPLILFFIAYQYTKDIITATGVLIIASAIQVSYLWIRFRKVEKMHIITLVLVVFFGGLTIALQDETFIKWKPTAVSWIFAVALIFSQLFTRKNLVQRMMEDNLELPANIWININGLASAFFFICGVLNIWIAYTFSQEFWVNFKVFGFIGLNILFVIGIGLYISPYISEKDAPVSKDEG